MANTGFLKNKVLFSPLASQSTLRPNNKRGRKNIQASLILTSLVDAFSILVIFLMMNSATDQSDFNADQVKLPRASQGQTSFKTASVKVTGDKFEVNGTEVSRDNLLTALRDLKANLSQSLTGPASESLVVIADREMDYQNLNPLIVMASRAGFVEFKFAVEQVAQK